MPFGLRPIAYIDLNVGTLRLAIKLKQARGEPYRRLRARRQAGFR